MKGAPLGSCWRYWPLDRSLYRDQIAIIIRSHKDALGDYDYDVWLSPMNKVYDLSDVVLDRHFKCISLNEGI